MQETHFYKNEHEDRLKGKIKGYSIFSNIGERSSRGTAILLREAANIEVLTEIEDTEGRFNLLTVKAMGEVFSLCNIYGENKPHRKKPFFQKLLGYNFTRNIILGGDLNIVENSGMDRIPEGRTEEGVKQFKEVVRRLQIKDAFRQIHENKKEYTYINDHKQTSSRIDRLYTTENFEVKEVKHRFYPVSDHKIVDVKIEIDRKIDRIVQWRCNNQLLEEVESREAIRKEIKKHIGWEREQARKRNYDLEEMLSRVYTMSRWARIKKDIRTKIQKIGKNRKDTKFRKIRAKWDEYAQHRQNNRQDEAKQAKEEYIQEVRSLGERIFLKEKFKGREFNEENRKSLYLIKREVEDKEKIRELVREDGQITRDGKVIRKEIREFFRKQYERQETNERIGDMFLKYVERIDEEVEDDELWIDEEEIDEALAKITENSTPGIDGFSWEFYKAYADELKTPLRIAFNSLLKGDDMTMEMKTVRLKLLRKKKGQISAQDLRPISLMCVETKILARIIATKIAKKVETVIAPTQTAAIKGRSIQQNVRCIIDLFEDFKRRKAQGFLLNLDNQKAFDKVERQYLYKIMDKIGLGKYNRWIKILYKDSQILIDVNGENAGTIRPTRGIRQGCPLSPLLYVIFIQPLLSIIEKKDNITGLHIPGYGKLKTFAHMDDVSVIVASIEDLRNVMGIVNNYSLASGIRVNYEKSNILQLGREREGLREVRGIPVKKMVKILGIQLGWGRYEEETYIKLREKLKVVMRMYSLEKLSLMGRSIIANTVICGKIYYIMRLLHIPARVRVDIERDIQHFIWGGLNKQNVGTDIMYRDKDKGGWNVSILKLREQALMCKFITWALQNKEAPFAAYLRYYIGRELRHIVDFSNNAPHTDVRPTFYNKLLEAYKNINKAIQGIDWEVVTTKEVYIGVKKKYIAELGKMDLESRNMGIHLNRSWEGVHRSGATSHVVVLNWKLVHGKIYVGNYCMSNWGKDINNGKCYMCGALETINHLFIECRMTKALDREIRNNDSLYRNVRNEEKEIRFRNYKHQFGKQIKKINHLVNYRNYAIWRYRERVRISKERGREEGLLETFNRIWKEKREYDKVRGGGDFTYQPFDNG